MKWVLKTSAVHVAKERGEATFRSMHEVPADLKREIKKALEGPKSQTIYIANQAAYERLESRREPSRGKTLVWAGLGAALTAAALTWVVLSLFDRP